MGYYEDMVFKSMKLQEGKLKSSIVPNPYGSYDVLFSLPRRNERYHGTIVSELPVKTGRFSNGYSYTGSVEANDGNTYDLYCDNDRFDGTYFALKHSESNPRGTRIGKISKGMVVKEDYNSDSEEERRIQTYLDDHDLWGEVEVNDGVAYVEINWGDWKHEHLRCEYLMNDLGYQQDYVEVTEEDGSDCYSAIHTYIKKDMNESLTESLNGVDKVAQASQNIVQNNRNTWLPIYYDIKNKTVLTEDDYKKLKDKKLIFKVTELIKPNTAEDIERAVNRALSM